MFIVRSATLIAFVLCTSTAQAEDVTLEVNGGRFCGALTSEGEGIIEIETEAGTMSFPLAMVDRRTPGPCDGEVRGPVVEQETDGQVTLRVVGSNTIGANLMPDIIETYVEAEGYSHEDWQRGATEAERVLTGTADGRPTMAITVEAQGSGDAFEALTAGSAQIGMSSRPADEDEVVSIREATGVDILAAGNEHVLGLDGLAIIVHESNPLGVLSLEQIAAIFSGAVTDWRQVGGSPAPIAVYARDDESGTYATFRDLVLGEQTLSEGAERFDSSTSLSNAVSSDPNGIGFVSLASVKNAKPLDIASACGISYAPDEFNVRTEDYTLARRLFLYTAAARPEAAALVDFSLSPAAATSLADDGFVALDPVIGSPDYTAARLLDVWRSAPSAPSDRYNEMLVLYGMTMRNATRLSTTFRFLQGSARIDSRGVRDVERVVDFASSAAANGMTLNFIGFTDDVGTINDNATLAKQRAESIAGMVLAAAEADGMTIEVGSVVGVGPVAPVTCNASDDEREKNRRVEIWLTES